MIGLPGNPQFARMVEDESLRSKRLNHADKGADRIRTGVLGLSGSYLYEHRTAADPEGATDGDAWALIDEYALENDRLRAGNERLREAIRFYLDRKPGQHVEAHRRLEAAVRGATDGD